jgi:large subunit ribosomal protein L7A
MCVSYEKVKQAKQVVTGTKQTRKAIERGQASLVILAQDADHALTQSLQVVCEKNNVAYTYVPSMRELGKASGIQVGTATVAIIK